MDEISSDKWKFNYDTFPRQFCQTPEFLEKSLDVIENDCHQGHLAMCIRIAFTRLMAGDDKDDVQNLIN